MTINSAQPNENYSYDGIGNRTASHLSAGYSYQPFNKLTSTASAAYTYDNNGNLSALVPPPKITLPNPADLG